MTDAVNNIPESGRCKPRKISCIRFARQAVLGQNIDMMKQLLGLLLFVFFLVEHPVCEAEILEVKFYDESGITIDRGKLVSGQGEPLFPGSLGPDCRYRVMGPVFGRPPEKLIADRRTASARAGRRMPDLTQYFHIEVDNGNMERVLTLFRTHPQIEHVALLPDKLAQASAESTTPDFSAYQEYLFDVSGPHINRAWDYPGGRGEGITVAVLDAHCNRNHEDLVDRLADDAVVIGGIPGGLPGAIDHGTAVAGLLVAGNNGFGITGICQQASMRIYFVDAPELLANAIDITQAALHFGDVILVELQTPGPNHPGGEDQYGMVPVEFIPSVYDAITLAVSLGRIVIEPAGNGSQNLDDAIYEGVFDPGLRDSGAIIVGAGRPADRAPVGYTNYGSRVDVQGWAERINPCCQVWSTGYGDASGSPSEPNRLYTDRFSGTSSASAMVAGIAVCFQGAVRFRSTELLSPLVIRDTMIATGFSQNGLHHIGPLPDVGSAIESIPIAQMVTDIKLNQEEFAGGDPFQLSYSTVNPLETHAVIKYVALQCTDTWYFYDCDTNTFVPYVEGCPEILPPGTKDETLLSFTWPEGEFGQVSPGSGFAFFIVYVDLFEGVVLSNLDSVDFGWY